MFNVKWLNQTTIINSSQHAASGHEVHGVLNIDTWRDIDKLPE